MTLALEGLKKPTQQTINRRFDKFGKSYSLFYTDIVEVLQRMQSRTLKRLIEDAKTFTESNCGWGTFEIAPIVSKEASRIILARQMELKKHD